MLCREPKPAAIRRRREPERGALHHVLLRHLQTFLMRADERAGPGLPGFVRRELYRYLDCGILASGFARVHCASCGRDELVALGRAATGLEPGVAAQLAAVLGVGVDELTQQG